jgi:hypothetical protein
MAVSSLTRAAHSYRSVLFIVADANPDVAAIEAERGRELAHHPVDGIGVHGATFLLAFAVGTQRPEQRAVEVGAVGRRDRDRRAAALRSAG